MYNCIIFDVDGTMIDTECAVFASYQKLIFEEFGRYFTPEELKVGYGVPTYEALDRYGFKNIGEAEGKYQKYLTEAFGDVKAFDGIKEVLEILREKDIATGIVTSRNKHEMAMDLCLQEILKYFDFVVCSKDTERHKPEAEPLLKLIELAGAEASKTLYIGDTYFDYMCARNAGVKFALALWGAKNISEIKADYNLKSPGEILKLTEDK